MDKLTMHPITGSPWTQGRYMLGTRELISGDLIVFDNAGCVIRGRVEHDGWRYVVVAGARRWPLSELMQGRYIGSRQLA